MSYEWPHGGSTAGSDAALKTQIEGLIQAGLVGCLFPLKTDMNRAIFNSGALAITSGGATTAKTVSTIYGAIGSALFSKAAANMAALAGTVTNAKFNVFVFMVDAAGTLTTSIGVEAATLGGVVFPTVATTKAVIGFVIINPTGTGNFVGGTTALDDATVAPGAVYVNTVGAFYAPQ